VDAARRALAAEVLAASRAHDERQGDRLARYRNVEPETALIDAQAGAVSALVPIGAGVRLVLRGE